MCTGPGTSTEAAANLAGVGVNVCEQDVTIICVCIRRDYPFLFLHLSTLLFYNTPPPPSLKGEMKIFKDIHIDIYMHIYTYMCMYVYV